MITIKIEGPPWLILSSQHLRNFLYPLARSSLPFATS